MQPRLLGLIFPFFLFLSEPTLAKPIKSPTYSNAHSLVSSPNFTFTIAKLSTWIEQPALGMDELVSRFSGDFQAYFTPSIWPNIKDEARRARVPVILYQDAMGQNKSSEVPLQKLNEDLELIQHQGLAPISVEALITHLRNGMPLPEKPIVLTFDYSAQEHYQYIYPLLKRYGYPALFSIQTDKLNPTIKQPSISFARLKEIATDPSITIAVSNNFRYQASSQISDEKLNPELNNSKQNLEALLGAEVKILTYTHSHSDRRWIAALKNAGYSAAFTSSDTEEGFAEQSENLLSIKRFSSSSFQRVIKEAWGGPELPRWRLGFDFSAPVRRIDTIINHTPLRMFSGGRPATIHARSRYQVQKILSGTKAIAGVDGGFFSLKYLDSNVMIGPVLSQTTGQFITGNLSDSRKLTGRPLVLINPFEAKFIPFNPVMHNTLAGVNAEMEGVTDAFVAAAWLVRDSTPQTPEAFGALFDFNAARHRAFWGINQNGQPQIGISTEPIGSVDLGKALAKAGFRDAVMLDSGASTSLAFQGESLVGYIPRPVPHVVGLIPPQGHFMLNLLTSPIQPIRQ
jgi:poly-beta-1,6-N-acetyl-D-glucosamine N-deacetylase